MEGSGVRASAEKFLEGANRKNSEK